MTRPAIQQYLEEIFCLLKDDPPESIVDLGCGNGLYTSKYKESSRTDNALGVDVHVPSLHLASQRRIETLRYDLNHPLPFADESFDAVISTQVIEHLTNNDQFASEVLRILKPGGYAIISTENLSSWSNVVSLILGFQPHVESVSKVKRIGNPFSGNYGEIIDHKEMHHVNVFTYRSFLEFLKLHGFEIEAIRCSGYPPAPDRIGWMLSKVDPVHSRYLTVKVRKAERARR